MKLELKHLAGYLPYGLRGIATHENNENVLLTGIGRRLGLTVDCDFKVIGKNFGISNFIPILHPLSDLTKEIEVNGEKFVPIDELRILGSIPKSIDYYYYSQIQKLYEWHFDIYGLIENGLAIDINTLK